jgi:hypothetical protein
MADIQARLRTFAPSLPGPWEDFPGRECVATVDTVVSLALRAAYA